MSITVNKNLVDITNKIDPNSLRVDQNLTSQVDRCSFKIKKSSTVEVGDDIEVLDGAVKVFAGEVINIQKVNLSVPDGLIYTVQAVDYSFALQNILISESYTDETIEDIIKDIFDTYVSGFTYTNVDCNFEIEKIVFNNINVIQALKRLVEIVKYEFYVDADKDLHFFQKFTNTSPFSLTDTDTDSIKGTLDFKTDGSQIANAVKVRGGEYDGTVFEEVLTAGAGQKSFKTKNKMADLTVELNTGGGYVSKTVGVEFINDFTSYDVLYNYQDQSFRFENGLSAGDLIKYTGKPKIRVLVESEDPASISTYGRREKLIQDTSIEDNATARQRASAELGAYKEPNIEAKFSTYTAGLRAGQVINIKNTKFGIDADFIIKKMSFKSYTNDTYIYEAILTTTRQYELVEILSLILQADNVKADESEQAEKLKKVEATISVGESITRITGELDQATIEITENIQKDPLGANTEPDWVLAPYFPKQNLALNSDFEEIPASIVNQTSSGYIDGTANGNPTPTDYGWYATVQAGSYCKFDETVKRNNKNTMKGHIDGSYFEIHSNNANFSWGYNTDKQFEIIPSHTYKFSGWMKIENISGDSGHGFGVVTLLSKLNGDSSESKTLIPYTKINQDWVYYEEEFTAGANSVAGHIRLTGYGHTGAGTLKGDVWWSEIKLIDTTSSKRVGLLDKSMQVYGISKAEVGVGLVSYWNFDENTGLSTFDSIGNNEGVITDATWATGKINSGLHFEGSSGVIATDTNHLSTGFSVSAWIKLDNVAGYGSIVSKGAANDRNYLLYTSNNHGLYGYEIEGGANRFYTGSKTLLVDTWYHLVVTWNGAHVQGYVNGEADGNPYATTDTPANGGSNLLYIGRSNSSQEYFDGTIDEVLISNKALTTDEIDYLYNEGVGKQLP